MYLQTGDNASLSMEISSFFGAMWVPVPEDLAPGDVSLTPKQSMKFRIEITPALDNYELNDAVMIESNRERWCTASACSRSLSVAARAEPRSGCLHIPRPR